LVNKHLHVMLADFGVSEQLNSAVRDMDNGDDGDDDDEGGTSIRGSPYWMAPEVIRQTKYDQRADIWSLGITLIEMADGLPPHYDLEPVMAMRRVASSDPPEPKRPGLSSAFRRFVARCLVKDRAQRPSAADLLADSFIAKSPQSGECLRPLIERLAECQRSRPPLSLDPFQVRNSRTSLLRFEAADAAAASAASPDASGGASGSTTKGLRKTSSDTDLSAKRIVGKKQHAPPSPSSSSSKSSAKSSMTTLFDPALSGVGNREPRCSPSASSVPSVTASLSPSSSSRSKRNRRFRRSIGSTSATEARSGASKQPVPVRSVIAGGPSSPTSLLGDLNDLRMSVVSEVATHYPNCNVTTIHSLFDDYRDRLTIAMARPTTPHDAGQYASND
jgi:serine/threonine-protein kinase 24/25/MST4